MKRLLIVVALLGLCACQTVAPKADAGAVGEAIVLGRGYTIESAALGETRRINVYLPPGYDAGEQAYPVLYLIDGGVEQDFIHIAGLSQHATISGSFREMIVVGIETVDRRRELTFPATKDASLRVDYPTHGEGAKFRAFIADEVMPWVEARYRTDGYDVVMGESLAGLFVMETYLRQPSLFDGYAAIDPSLWWDHEALPRAAPGLLAGHVAQEIGLFLAAANEGAEMRKGQDMLADTVREAVPGPHTFVYRSFEDERHSTIYHRAALEALRMMFPSDDE
jgi:predicted alpha/beta superfamily hydrolase